MPLQPIIPVRESKDFNSKIHPIRRCGASDKLTHPMIVLYLRSRQSEGSSTTADKISNMIETGLIGMIRFEGVLFRLCMDINLSFYWLNFFLRIFNDVSF